MNASIPMPFALVLCALSGGCLATSSDVAASETKLTERINQVQSDIAAQNQLVVAGDSAGLAAQVAAGKQQAEAALAAARENERRTIEAERSLAALTAKAADFVTGGTVSSLTARLDDLKSTSGEVSGGELFTTLASAAAAALAGGALGKTGKSRAQPQIDELYDETKRLGEEMAARHPDVVTRRNPPQPARAA